MKKKKHLVVNQEIRIEQSHTNNSLSPYWGFVELHGRTSDENPTGEERTGNPDSLEDNADNKLWSRASVPELAERIIEEFADATGKFPILSEQENTILRIYTVSGDIEEVKRITKLSRSSIRTYLARIRSKMLRLIKSRNF